MVDLSFADRRGTPKCAAILQESKYPTQECSKHILNAWHNFGLHN